jgi:muconolactone delta-isomerase
MLKEHSMKFLVTSKTKFQPPLDMVQRLLEGSLSWADKYQRQGKLQDVWVFAGKDGGALILNVDSIDELDQIMKEFPVFEFSEITVQPLADLRTSLQRAMKMYDDMNRR